MAVTIGEEVRAGEKEGRRRVARALRGRVGLWGGGH